MTKKPLPTIERLHQLFSYDEETGVITRRQRTARGGINFAVGNAVGSLRTDGYRYMQVDYSRIMAHRIAFAIHFDRWPVGEIDHINGVRDDNRICNLREVTATTNQENKRVASRHSTTGLLGVSIEGNRFRARIQTAGKKKLIGVFDTPAEAHQAYLAAKRILHKGCTI